MSWKGVMDLLALVQEWMPQLIVAAGATLKLTALSFVVATLLGVPIVLARLSRHRTVAKIAGAYVEVARGLPALAVLFVIYFGMPAIGVRLQAFEAAVIGLGLIGSAYVAEIYRSGLQAVDRGQM